MSNKSRLQFSGSLVKSGHIWGINYAAGMMIPYGATCPGEKFTTTKTLNLKVARLRTDYIGLRFRAETDASSGDVQISFQTNGVEVHSWNLPASDQHDYVHIHDIGSDGGISDYLLTFEITAILGAASFVKNIQFFGLWDKSFPARFLGDVYSESS